MSDSVPQIAAEGYASGRSGIRRVLTRWDLILYGLTILTPTAPYPVYGIIQQVSHGHAALSYVVAMVAMLFTAASYGKMAAAYPSAGSTYTYVQQTLTPYVGFLAGWAMILDYFLIPLESIIYSAITAARLIPVVPYILWVVLFTAGIIIINIRGIRIVVRANAGMMAMMIGCAGLFIGLAVRYIATHHGFHGLISVDGIFRPNTFQFQPLMLGAGIATLYLLQDVPGLDRHPAFLAGRCYDQRPNLGARLKRNGQRAVAAVVGSRGHLA